MLGALWRRLPLAREAAVSAGLSRSILLSTSRTTTTSIMPRTPPCYVGGVVSSSEQAGVATCAPSPSPSRQRRFSFLGINHNNIIRAASSIGPRDTVSPTTTPYSVFGRPTARMSSLASNLLYSTNNTNNNNTDPETTKPTQESSPSTDNKADSKADNKADNKANEGDGAKQKADSKGKKTTSNPNANRKSTEDPMNRMKEIFNRDNMPFWVTGGVLGVCALLMYKSWATRTDINWVEFKTVVLPEVSNIESITVHPHFAEIKVKDPKLIGPRVSRTLRVSHGSPELFEEKLIRAQEELNRDPLNFVHVHHSDSDIIGTLLSVLSIGLLVWLFFGVQRSMGGTKGIMGIGKSKHQIATKKDIKTRFSDVAGLDEAKVEVMEFVEFLKNPEKFRRLGATIPKGALLVGPPGTGKTLLAKAVAGEAAVPFLSISGSDFLEMFVGVGPARVRDLFKAARQYPACIIWIDEIDAVGRARGKGPYTNDERENTLNQLLVEMDGFDPRTGVVVLAGTNRSDILDSALLRPGRFDRQISIDLPDIKGRNQIFGVHLAPLKLAVPAETISKKLSALTPGFSGADIANACNEAALVAARAGKKAIELEDFEKAIERIIGGLEKKERVLSPKEKERVAWHEAGHAIAGWFLRHADPLLKVSIIPRGSAALGYAQVQPHEQYLYTSEQIQDRICMTLAGRAAEEIVYGVVSSGARDDLERVASYIYAQITKYGMNELVGPLSFRDPEESGETEKTYSQTTAELIDQEARRIAKEAYQRTLALLREKHEQLTAVATRLLEREVLSREDMIELVGARPFPERVSYDDIISASESARPSKTEDEPSSTKPSPSTA